MNKECTQTEGQTITVHEVLPQPTARRAGVDGGADGTTSAVGKSRGQVSSRQEDVAPDEASSRGRVSSRDDKETRDDGVSEEVFRLVEDLLFGSFDSS